MPWSSLLADPAPLAFDPVPFDHPLYVLFSSGTTGLPKPIVHGHGGILLEHLKALALHTDLGPADRFCWFTTTGWMMWNYLVSGLAVGSSIVLFDGNPAWPDLSTLWRLAAETRTTYLGVSAPFLMACRAAGLEPGRDEDLAALRGVGSTGAPLPAAGFRWVAEHVSDAIPLGSLSGGTDLCTGFLGPSPLVPVWAGEISCRMLGARVEAFDPAGRPLIGEQGELVITAPMPSMPVGLWGDADGSRMRAAYFEPWPGVWRHGDWLTITDRGSCLITGRSDATLNRGGVRLGTAEFYAVVESLPEVADSLVVHLEDQGGGPGELLLFVALRAPATLDDDLRRRIATALREGLSPRHVPDAVLAVPAIPRTLSGKKLEVPVKRILQGQPADDAAARGRPRRSGVARAVRGAGRRPIRRRWLTAPVASASPWTARACLLLSGIGGLVVGILTSLGQGAAADRGRVTRELRGGVVRRRVPARPPQSDDTARPPARPDRAARDARGLRPRDPGPGRRRVDVHGRVLGSRRGRRRARAGRRCGVGARPRSAARGHRGRAARGDPDRRGGPRADGHRGHDLRPVLGRRGGRRVSCSSPGSGHGRGRRSRRCCAPPWPRVGAALIVAALSGDLLSLL